jgi:hypothetical protein
MSKHKTLTDKELVEKAKLLLADGEHENAQLALWGVIDRDQVPEFNVLYNQAFRKDTPSPSARP